MAFSIEVLSFTQTGDDKFEATGTIEGNAFLARTILYRKEPIFKVQESDEKGEVGLQRMADSQFTRGMRIAIAAKLKAIRLGKVAPPEAKSDDLGDLTVKALRARCKEANIAGYHRKGVNKAHLVAMLEGRVVTAQAA